jgi:plastocyanin
MTRKRYLLTALACLPIGLGLMGAGLRGAAAHGSQVTTPRQTVTTKYPKGTVVQLHRRTVHVSIHNYTFVPASLVVSRGTQIIWTNTDQDPHTVVSNKQIWSSDALDTTDQFKRAFKITGSFPYHCSIHPFMHGTIIVK